MGSRITEKGVPGIETGSEIKSKQSIVPEWMKALADDKQYEVSRLIAPFGTYVLSATEVKS